MLPRIKEDLLAMLRNAIAEIKAENFGALAEISNHSIHNASIYQDEDSLSTAVLLYALSKILNRCLQRQQGEGFKDVIGRELAKAAKALEEDRQRDYESQISSMLKNLQDMDSRLKLYITEVINQAQIKKGSRIYEHGLSLANAASMLGVTQWELQSYIGHTTITEQEEGTDIKSRLAFARSLFE
jgi:hypothetical protein